MQPIELEKRRGLRYQNPHHESVKKSRVFFLYGDINPKKTRKLNRMVHHVNAKRCDVMLDGVKYLSGCIIAARTEAAIVLIFAFVIHG